MSPILQAGNHIASVFLTLALMIAVAGVTAFLAARHFGGRSRNNRQLIFSLVGGVGLLLALALTYLRLRGNA